MNRKKTVQIISFLVIVFSVICSVLPLITKNELAEKTVISTFGETVTLYVASFVIFGPICIASYIFFFIIMRKIGRYNTVKMRDDYDY